MRKKVLTGIVTLIFVALLTSCGKIPQDKINAVTTGLDSASAVEANVYLSNEYTAIQDSMKSIIADIDLQKSKWFKNFKSSEIKLDSIILKVTQLKDNAVTKKEKVKNEDDALIAALKNAIDENAKLVVKAKKDKKGKPLAEKFKKEIKTIESSLVEDKALFDKGQYMDVFSKVTLDKSNMDNINNKLKDALTKKAATAKSKKRKK